MVHGGKLLELNKNKKYNGDDIYTILMKSVQFKWIILIKFSN